MRVTSARLLRLLSLLQARHEWTGPELADRLGVSARTVRRDIERLRELDYPVVATQGTAGYRLGPGAALPPLLLDDEEAVAVALSLLIGAPASVNGIEEATLRARQKLQHVLPSRLRQRVATVYAATARSGVEPAPQVTADTLTALADACRRHQLLRCDYIGFRGDPTVRTVEPHHIVHFHRYWYLVAWDRDRADWRTFRVDRLTPRTPAGPSFPPREPPDGDAVSYLARRLSQHAWPVQATVLVHRPAEEVAGELWPGMGVVEPRDGSSCLLHLGAETARDLAWMVTTLNMDFTLTDDVPPELAAALRQQAARCLRALGDP